MGATIRKVELRERRKKRIRKKIQGGPERPRLSVFRSSKHIYAQIVEDGSGHTLAAASTLDREVKLPAPPAEPAPAAPEEPAATPKGGKKAKGKGKASEPPPPPAEGHKVAQARAVGQLLAQKALARGITAVVFDRNGFLYHGRVKALAEGARAAGLKF